MPQNNSYVNKSTGLRISNKNGTLELHSQGKTTSIAKEIAMPRADIDSRKLREKEKKFLEHVAREYYKTAGRTRNPDPNKRAHALLWAIDRAFSRGVPRQVSESFVRSLVKCTKFAMEQDAGKRIPWDRGFRPPILDLLYDFVWLIESAIQNHWDESRKTLDVVEGLEVRLSGDVWYGDLNIPKWFVEYVRQ